MGSRDWRDLFAGALLFGLGAAVVVYAVLSFPLGTLSRMGPGMFPAGVGALLAVLGFCVFVPALRREGVRIEVDVRACVAILLGILCFSFLLRPFGLIPSIFVTTFIVSRADGRLTLPGVIALGASLSTLISLIFVLGLGVQVRLVAWPW